MSDIPSPNYEITPLADEAGLAEMRRELPEAAQEFLKDFRERHADSVPFSINDIPVPPSDGARRRAIQSMYARPTRSQR